jgi:D-alanyl-lipoteichoic acid acyltransferase DltB (MBOAT superfamily)
VVIADSCAEYVNTLFHHSAAYSGSAHAVGALFFAFQIYCDFSGYSDIALGTARLFGIDLLRNFAFPYFSRDIAEFWRRWHISLSSWFRDYLYIPLGGSKGGMGKTIRNILLIFLVSGFWHGANWTFIVWGLLNALYILPSVLMKTHRRNLTIVAEGKVLPSSREFFSMIATFGLTVLAWIFFRAESVGDAIHYVKRIFSRSFFTKPVFPGSEGCLPLCLLIVLFLLIEWQGREQQYAIQNFGLGRRRVFKWSFYYTILLMIYYFSVVGSNTPFIYFQF